MIEMHSYRDLLRLTLWLAASTGGVALVASLCGFLVAFRGRVSAERAKSRGWFSLSNIALWGCGVSLLASILAMCIRYIEVRHWPAQSMYEVVPLGVTAGFLSTLVLLD